MNPGASLAAVLPFAVEESKLSGKAQIIAVEVVRGVGHPQRLRFPLALI